MGKFLLLLQAHLNRWTKPAAQPLILELLLDLTHNHPHRSGCRKYRAAPTIDRPESANQATTTCQARLFSAGVSIALYDVLETSPA